MQKLYWNQSSGRRHSKIFFPKGSRAEGRFEVLTIVFVFSRRYSSVTSVLVLRIFWKMLTWKGAKYYENKKQKQNKQQIPSVRNTRQAINNLYRICIFLLRLPPVTQVVNEPYFHCCWRKVVEPEKIFHLRCILIHRRNYIQERNYRWQACCQNIKLTIGKIRALIDYFKSA